jgi:hypothetical protein
VDVDQRVVAENGAVVVGDETHPAHVRGKRVDMVDTPGSLQAAVQPAQVEHLELVGVRVRVLRKLLVHPSHPVALLLQVGDEVAADEAAGAGDENLLHGFPLLTS